MEISTPASTFVNTNQAHAEPSIEGLAEEDQHFLTKISTDLDAILEQPSAATVLAILNYSKSL